MHNHTIHWILDIQVLLLSMRPSACDQVIPAFEMVMRARTTDARFACGECKHRFCVGDVFYLEDHRILCEYDRHQGQCR